MKRADNKSDCPVNFAVEVFGDTWSLLIVRDMAALGKKTYSEFQNSEERIGSSVLADRLVHLEQKGIIEKQPDQADRRKIIYTLTEAGLAVLPIAYEIAIWGSRDDSSSPWLASMQFDKQLVLRLWREAILSGSSFFLGPNSVMSKLGFSDFAAE